MAKHEYEIQTRFFDEDTFGHVNNGIYLAYLENARARMYREDAAALLEGSARSLVEPGQTFFDLFGGINRPLVGSLRIDYLQEARHRWEHPLVVRTWVSRIGSSSHVVSFEVVNAERTVTHAVAESVIVQASIDTGRPAVLTEAQRAVLASWWDEPIAFR